jgi:hypothetical protein
MINGLLFYLAGRGGRYFSSVSSVCKQIPLIVFFRKQSDNRQTSLCRANSLKIDLEKREELPFVDC